MKTTVGVGVVRPSLSVDEANTAVAVARTKVERLAAYQALAAAAATEAQRLAADGVQPADDARQTLIDCANALDETLLAEHPYRKIAAQARAVAGVQSGSRAADPQRNEGAK